MILFIILFGVMTCVAGLLILIEPEIIFGVLRKNYQKIELHVLAVVLRLVLGVFLIEQASVSRFPFIIQVFGWLSILAAVSFAAMGHRRFCRIIGWALSLEKTYGRIGGVIASSLGVFLVYAFMV